MEIWAINIIAIVTSGFTASVINPAFSAMLVSLNRQQQSTLIFFNLNTPILAYLVSVGLSPIPASSIPALAIGLGQLLA